MSVTAVNGPSQESHAACDSHAGTTSISPRNIRDAMRTSSRHWGAIQGVPEGVKPQRVSLSHEHPLN